MGPPLSWIETVLWEARNEFLSEGAAEADLDMLLALTRRKWDYLRAAAADPALAVGLEREALEAAFREVRAMAALVEYCEGGGDHDRFPLRFPLEHLGREVDVGAFSHLREINRDSSFSVLA